MVDKLWWISGVISENLSNFLPIFLKFQNAIDELIASDELEFKEPGHEHRNPWWFSGAKKFTTNQFYEEYSWRWKHLDFMFLTSKNQPG